MAKTWREYARPIISDVLKKTKGQPEKDIRKALRDAYPWGERAMHPYKIWCDEIKVQRGFKKFNHRQNDIVPVNQTKMF